MASASTPLRQVEPQEPLSDEERWADLEKEDGLTPDERRELHARLRKNWQSPTIPAIRL